MPSSMFIFYEDASLLRHVNEMLEQDPFRMAADR